MRKYLDDIEAAVEKISRQETDEYSRKTRAEVKVKISKRQAERQRYYLQAIRIRRERRAIGDRKPG